MNLEQARLLVRETIGEAILLLEMEGLPIPVELKRRDPREPKRRDKERAEDRVIEIILRHWRKQRASIREYLAMQNPDRKALGDPWGEPDPDDVADLTIALTDAARAGVWIVAEAIGERSEFANAKRKASTWAALHAGEMFRLIDETTGKAVRDAIATFIDTPGMTIADVVNLLPFEESRATSIAVTEITNAYAEGQIQAGAELRDEFPGMAVRKTWFTNNDDRVCEICGPMEGQEVDLDGEFLGGDGERYQEPPAHINCRCWIDVTTDMLA